MGRILNFGSLNLDHTYKVPHFVQPGETLTSLNYRMSCGGKGLNQSIALARAGAQVYHAGKIGADGCDLTRLLESSGANTDLIDRTGTKTGHAIIQVDSRGENCILLFGGANRELTESQVERTLAQFRPGELLVLQNEVNLLSLIMHKARGRGLKIVLNPSPFDQELKRCPLELVSLFVVNQVEAEGFTGEKCPERQLDTLRARFPNASVLLTLGGDGSVFQTSEGRWTQEIFPVPVVDTTGAGDTFLGYFVSLWERGETPSRCLEVAAKAAAIAVSRPGAADSIPFLPEVLEN